MPRLPGHIAERRSNGKYQISQEPDRTASRDYKLILNWDGAPTGFAHVPMSREQLMHFAVGQFVDTQIDAISWCASEDGNTVSWKSDQFEIYGQGSNFTEGRVQNWRYMANAKHLVDSGVDVPEVMGEACRNTLRAIALRLGINGAFCPLVILWSSDTTVMPDRQITS